MVIDTSALLAIILSEPDAEEFLHILDHATRSGRPLYLPASVLVEGGITAGSRGRGKRLDQLIDSLQPQIVPLDEPIARLAVQAFRKFGKGQHKAALNFGDCMSYATAEHLNQPLLFKGTDFSFTPVQPA